MPDLNIGTEQRNSRTEDLDLLSAAEILRIMNEEDSNVIAAVRKALPQIEKVAAVMIRVLRQNGRIVYAGAGTSGRLGILDAVECGPTFGCTTEFTGVIAGGPDAVFRAAEGAEDSETACAEDLKAIGFCSRDLLIGISASGRTPYVLGGIRYAHGIGAETACICCNTATQIGAEADHPIEVCAGPEILTGSTRLKSGTCQKIILNMLSTVSMIGTGRVYRNLMINVRPANAKLIERCRHIVMEAAGCNYETADEALKQTDNACGEAIVMILLKTDAASARRKIREADGSVRKAIGDGKI
ncbi:MAG: N-acetylmuramic acid 6-phosphate etherase [Solobacterium sp.]|nr:N-acetylmuramic acid 6-phosphate etherase [Solobacterium sp.]